MRTDAQIQAAYDARKVVPFGFDSADFFGNLDILSLKGSDRAGDCQAPGCPHPAPIELIGLATHDVSGYPLTRSRRTCGWHFWLMVDAVLWLR